MVDYYFRSMPAGSQKKVFLFEVCIICSTVQPNIWLSGQPDIRQMKPDIWPDTGYKKAGYPVQP